MANGVKVSVTELAGPEKSRAVKKALAYIITAVGMYAFAGTCFLTWALFKNYFCVECRAFDDRVSIWFLVGAILGVIMARLLYKYVKRTEAFNQAKEALKRAAKVDFVDVNNNGIDDDIERQITDILGKVPDAPEPAPAPSNSNGKAAPSDAYIPAERVAEMLEGITRQNRQMKAFFKQHFNKEEAEAKDGEH
jgi:hypothetical protein